MSADYGAQGLALAAGNAAGQRTRCLVSSGRSGPLYGAAGASAKTALSATLPAGAILGGALLRLRGMLVKYAPINAGHNLFVKLGGVTIAQSYVQASLATFHFEHEVFVSHDRRWGFAYSANLFDNASMAAGLVAATGAKTGGVATLNANQVSSTIAFASYSAPPTVETVLVDFAQPVELRVEIQALNGDVVELLAFSCELVASGPVPANTANPIATTCWGTSITAGTGASAVSGVPQGWVDILRRTRAGRPIVNAGLGGQTASQIADRLVADPVAGRHWDAVLDMVVNNASADGPAWWAAVQAQIDRVLAFRSPAARTVVWNAYPRSDWTTGTAFRIAMDYVNAQLAATYGSMVCDVCTPFVAGGGNGVGPAANYADAIHPTNAGHAILASATDAKMAALGWV